MTGRRIAAVLVAVVLIAGAFLLRRNVIESGDDDPAATDASGPATEAGALVCITELAAACDAVRAAHPELAVRVEAAGTTLDRLAASADAPMWLTVEPFPAMLDALRTSAGQPPLGGESEAVAASQLAVATPSGGRADVLATFCAAAPLWRCLGEQARAPWTDLEGDPDWGTVRPSLGVVEREAMALGSFAAAVAGYFGTADVSRSAWELDPAFIPWLGRLSGAVDEAALSGGTPLATMATRPALDVAATSGAEHATLDGSDVQYPEPSMWLEAVLAVPGGAAAPAGLGDEIAAALAEAGWDQPAAAEQSLPSATTMLALRALWQEATT